MCHFHRHGLTLNPAWMSIYIHYKTWSEITYPFRHFNGPTVEVPEWISNSISHFIRHDYLSMHAHIQRRCYRGFLVTSHLLPPTIGERTLQTSNNDAIDSNPCCPTVWKLCSAAASSRNFSPRNVTFSLSHAVGFVASLFIQLLRCVTFFMRNAT